MWLCRTVAVSRKAWANTYGTFTSLLPARRAYHPKTMKAELLSFIEEVYTAQYNQAMGVQRKKKPEPYRRKVEPKAF